MKLVPKQSFLLACKSRKDQALAAAVLLGLGFKHWQGKTDSEEIAASTWDNGYPHLVYQKGSFYFCGCETDTNQNRKNFQFPEESAEFFSFINDNPKEVVVEGVGEYSARVTAQGVLVGCQTIPFVKVKEIASAITEFEKNQ